MLNHKKGAWLDISHVQEEMGIYIRSGKQKRGDYEDRTSEVVCAFVVFTALCLLVTVLFTIFLRPSRPLDSFSFIY